MFGVYLKYVTVVYLYWQHGATVDGLARREHVGLLLAGGLGGGQPQQRRGGRGGRVADLDPELLLREARQLNLQLLPVASRGPVIIPIQLLLLLPQQPNFIDGQIPGVQDDRADIWFHLLHGEDDAAGQDLLLEVHLRFPADVGGLDEVCPGVGVGVQGTQTLALLGSCILCKM